MTRWFCTLVARDVSNRILYLIEVDMGPQQRLTPRRIKKFLHTCPGVVRVERVNTVERHPS